MQEHHACLLRGCGQRSHAFHHVVTNVGGGEFRGVEVGEDPNVAGAQYPGSLNDPLRQPCRVQVHHVVCAPGAAHLNVPGTKSQQDGAWILGAGSTSSPKPDWVHTELGGSAMQSSIHREAPRLRHCVTAPLRELFVPVGRLSRSAAARAMP